MTTRIVADLAGDLIALLEDTQRADLSEVDMAALCDLQAKLTSMTEVTE